MRIGFITQWFPPETGTTAAWAIAVGLAARGHHVDVLTGHPNYPSGKLDPAYPLRPYRRERLRERLDVHRAPLYPSHDRSPVRRVANYTSFAAAATAVAGTRLQKPDAWLVYSSPASAALPALCAPPAHRAPTFLLIQDLWPDAVLSSGFLSRRATNIAERLITRYCTWTYQRAAGIGVTSPGMVGTLVARGVPGRKIHYTPNWVAVDGDLLALTRESTQRLRRALGLPSGRLFMYAGNLGEFQDLTPLVEAFQYCVDAQLVLVGDGVARRSLEALTSALSLSNVRFIEPQHAARIRHFIAAADVQIISLRDTPHMRVTTPSKLQASFAAGRPILAHAAGDVADAVERAGAGIATPPGHRARTIAAIQFLTHCSASELETMGRAARRHHEAHLTPDLALDRLERMIAGEHLERRSR